MPNVMVVGGWGLGEVIMSQWWINKIKRGSCFFLPAFFLFVF
jgi:hypothetical protein